MSTTTRAGRSGQIWRLASTLAIGVLAAIGASQANDAIVASWVLFGAAGVSMEILALQLDQSLNKLRLIAFLSTFVLWSVSFLSIPVWHMTGPYPVAPFYAVVLGIWLTITAYGAFAVHRAKAPTINQ